MMFLWPVESGHLDVVGKLVVSDAACSPQLGWTPCGQWKGLGSQLLLCWGGAPILEQGEWILEALTYSLPIFPCLLLHLTLECMTLYYKIIRFLLF